MNLSRSEIGGGEASDCGGGRVKFDRTIVPWFGLNGLFTGCWGKFQSIRVNSFDTLEL